MPTFPATPTSNSYAFDHLAFDWAFSVMDVVPTFNKIAMQRGFKKIARGQAITIHAYIEDIMTTPGLRFPMDPTSLPTVTLYNPDGTLYLAESNMTKVSIGVYEYRLQTTVNDQVGLYSAKFKAVNGTMTGRL